MTALRAIWRPLALAGTGVSIVIAQPAYADVKAGVDLWSKGDYAQAVQAWQAPAEAGDPDALFNLAQAHRLGRGVPADEKQAEDFYARAAALGHVQAADTYGLVLFQDGRREQAMPYIHDAARRGDPRAQYLLGVAHFNGDFASKDWVRAYALLTLANAAGLPQAAPALAQMDRAVPLAQRQEAATLAQTLRADADAARGRELAAAELAGTSLTVPRPVSSARVPQQLVQVDVLPSVSAARAAAEEARRVTGTESPADAGADFARPVQAVQAQPDPVAQASRVTPARTSAPATAAPSVARAATSAPSSGPWRVQLGAFSVAGNADRLWSQVSRRAELKGKSKIAVPSGRVTMLYAGGFATRAQADAACRGLKSAGHDCLVTSR